MSARGKVWIPLSGVLTGLVFCFTLFFGGRVSWGQEVTGPAILENRCSGCHPPSEEGGKLASIESVRKTPEGWELTLYRMVRGQGAGLSSDEARALVKYLSDRYGLAPKEVEPFRYALEKRPNVFEEVPSGAVQGACVRCHSYARIALQRRTREMWKRLPDMMASIAPNVESQTADLLDAFWHTVVREKVVPYFIKKYPFDSAAWREWQMTAKPKLEGSWKVVGHDLGKGGDYTGQMVIRSVGEDRYEGTFVHEFADGSQVSGKTTAIVYTGFQWRGVASLEDGKTNWEVFFAAEDGSALTGRRLLTNIGDLGRDETLFRDAGGARLLAVIPGAVQVGVGPQKIKLFGMNFPQNLTAAMMTFGEGVSVQAVTQAGDGTIVAEVVADKGAKVGPREVGVQGVEGKGSMFVYRTVDYIRLFPEKAYARPGGVRTPKIYQQFAAVAYAKGRDGVKGTKDDVRLGRVSPVTWSLQEYVSRINDDDVRYVGAVDENGLFTPAKDGPNPQRVRSHENVGDVWVEASYMPDGAKRPLRARAFLLSMPPKFDFQPID